MSSSAPPVAPQRVLGHFAGLFSARIAAAGASFLATVIVARYLAPERFGQFSILLVVSKVLLDLVSPALDATAVRFTAREIAHATEGPEVYFRSIVRLKVLLVAVILVAGLALSAPIKHWFLPDTETFSISAYLVYVAFIAGAGMIVWSIAQVYFQSNQKFAYMAAFEGANALLRLGAFGALIGLSLFTPLRFAETGLFVAYAGISVFIAVIALAFVPRPYLIGPVSTAATGAVLGYARWILAACAFTALSQAVDIFVLAALHSPPEVIGNYRAAVTLVMVGELAILTLFQVLLPKASQLTRGDELAAFLRRYQIRAVAIGCCFVPAILVAPYAATLVFGPAYGMTGGIFAVLLAGTAFMLSTAPAGAVVYSAGRARLIAVLELVKLVLIVGVGIPAAYLYGAYGMAVSVAVARALVAVLTFAAARWAVGRMAEAK